MGQKGNYNNLSLDLGNLILLQLAENGKTKAREYNEKTVLQKQQRTEDKIVELSRYSSEGTKQDILVV